MGKPSLSEQLKQQLAAEKSVEAMDPSGLVDGTRSGSVEVKASARIPAVDIGSSKVNTAVVSNKKVLSIDPKRCRPWRLHNRRDSWLNDALLQSLADSIKAVSQRQYGLVRKLEGDPDFDYEVIYGLRRCSACRLAGELFKAELTNADDAECYRLMHIENEESKDVSPLEKALSYKRAIAEGVYVDEKQLMATLGLRERHYRKIRQVGELEGYPRIFEFAMNYLPDLSFRVAERLLSAAGKLGNGKALALIVDKVQSDLLDDSAIVGEGTAIELLSARLEKSTSGSKHAFVPVTKKLLEGNKRTLIALQRNAKGQITLKIDPLAKDSPGFDAALEALIDELRK